MQSGSVFFWFFPLLPVTTFTVSRKRLLSGSALSQGSAASTRQANLGGGREGGGRGGEKGGKHSNGSAMLEKNNLSLSNMEMDLKHMD